MDEDVPISSSSVNYENDMEFINPSEKNNLCYSENVSDIKESVSLESGDNVTKATPAFNNSDTHCEEKTLSEAATSSEDGQRKSQEPAESHTEENNVEAQSESLVKQTPKRRLSVITISDTESDDSSDVCLVDSYQASASEAKRLRRGYSTSESDSTSSDDEEAVSDATIVICETPSILSKCCSTLTLSDRAPRESVASLNSTITQQSFIQTVAQHWRDEEDFNSSNITLYKYPFRICILDEFLQDPTFIHNLVDDMTTLDWSRRKMDLYEFHRSSDLVNLSWQRAIKSFYDLLKDQLMTWISEITNLKLTHVSASCALYGPGDHLLVHDDLMSDRKVAFVFYLSPWDVSKTPSSSVKLTEQETTLENIPESIEAKENNSEGSKTEDMKECKEDVKSSQFRWTDSMGGALDLLTCDDKGLPTVVVRSILPNNNSFVFFKVGSKTFHQVSEVLTYDYPRLTINGWFHGPPEETEPVSHVEVITPVPYKDLKETPHSELCQSSLNQWITSNYLSPRTKYKIQQQIENTSEISLEDFFLNKLYDEILSDLTNLDGCWEWQGPAHLQHYEVLNIENAGNSVKELHRLFSSEHFVKLLSEFTDLRLTSYHSLQIQRWTAASYTVIPPTAHSLVTELDVILYLGAPDKRMCGGSTVYLAPEEAESIPLITIEPLNNSLNLVYSDAGTTRFTKYINKLSFNKNQYFYTVACSYRE